MNVPKYLAPVLLTLVGGCDYLLGSDWLLAESRSPDGRQVARLWCENTCDVPGRTTLTISSADTVIEVTPTEVESFPPTADMPSDDRILTAYQEAAGGAPAPGVHWTSSNTLSLSIACPTDGNGRPFPREVTHGNLRVSIVGIGSCR